MTTDPLDLIRERLKELRAIRTQHMYDNPPQPGPVYSTANGETTFNDYSDMQYYEHLTGHIEELEYLIKAMER